MKNFKNILLDIIIILGYFFLGIVIIALVVSTISYGFNTPTLIKVVDQYLRLVLTSWPAAIIIVSTVLLLKQQDAIDEFIRKRMTSIGPGGVNASVPIATDATEKEIKAKAIEDIRQTNDVDMGNISVISKNTSKGKLSEKSEDFDIEENVKKTIPNSSNQNVVARLKKVRSVEDVMQIYLQTKYGEMYKPNIKLAKDDKSIILDGLLNSKKNKHTAVEVRYIGQNNKSDALKFITIRLGHKIRTFGIKRLLLVVVGDNLTSQDANGINKMLIGLVSQIEFYNFKNDVIEPVELPKNDSPTEVVIQHRDGLEK